jgi:hypothetical protein
VSDEQSAAKKNEGKEQNVTVKCAGASERGGGFAGKGNEGKSPLRRLELERGRQRNQGASI